MEWSENQMYAALSVIDVLVWVVFLALGSAGWIPFFGFIAAAAAILNVLVVAAWYYVVKTDGDFEGFQTTMKRQLSDEEARTLAEYVIVYKEGYRMATREGGVDPAVSPSDDKEDAERLYKLEFEPLNRNGRATLFINLEQDLSVDVEDLDSLESAAAKIQNKGIVKSWLNEDYEAAVQEKKESLGRSVDPTVTVTRTDEGTEIREMPARVENQNNSGPASAES